MHERKRWGLWYDTGTGKTLAALQFLDEAQPWPALVLCPLSIVEEAWHGDYAKFVFSFPATFLAGTRKVSDLDRTGVLVTNYEALRCRSAEFHRVPWRCVILDESTRIMNHRAQVTKAVIQITHNPTCEYVFAMSGYPTPKGLLDFWSQVDSFEPGHLESTFWAYRAKHFFRPRPYLLDWLWQEKPQHRDRIIDEVREVSTFCKKEECLDLPEQVFETRTCTLGKEEKAAYEAMLRDWIVELGKGTIVGASAIAELMKLRQITAGIAKTDIGWVTIGETKLRSLVELRQDIGAKPVLIVGQFRFEIERIHAEMKAESWTPAILYGGMSEAARTESIRGFQEGRFDTLVVHPESAGHGLTFVHCSDMIFASLDYNYENHYQVMQRIHRIGQRNACTYYFLMARDTVDYDIYDNLSRKESLGTKVVQRFYEAQREKAEIR
ncbi:MAG: DEAD/DEAH box helicase [Acidobacteria bacterium]|nr:DEAD/DEAH box helicase [Acidobacteriota bacterium]